MLRFEMSQPIESEQSPSSVAQRLAEAAARMSQGIERGAPGAGPYHLRMEQVAVFRDFARYLSDVAGRPPRAGSAFCRIILPPRTGKTVIAGHIIGRSGLRATVIVPTRTLVEQTARVLRDLLPGMSVGVIYGARRDLVEQGVNVTTYAFLQRCGADHMPEPLRQVELVFADEAHHVMTGSRRRLLQEGFEPGAIRIALTATPDYDAARRLASVFPDLVHEINLREALALELLAPLRVWVAEVDEDASRVHLVAGDFDQELLGRLMSSAPFFRATQLFRYSRPEADMPAIIACASRQQAHDLHRYLVEHRPPDRPEPALILGDTPNTERERLLADFERGEVDTLVQVGVLLEGWSSLRCKLLVDLAPTASRVRATQKSFRVMTRAGDAEARIYVLLPKDLPSTPVLPMDLFGEQGEEYLCGARVESKRGEAPVRTGLEKLERTPIAGVELKQRLLVSTRFAKPALERTNLRQIRRVLESCPEFHPDCGVFQFRGFEFSHPLFHGRGDFLLTWLGVPPTRAGLAAFLGRLYPDAIGSRILAEAGEPDVERWREDDVAALEERMAYEVRMFGRPFEDMVTHWRAYGGRDAPAPSLDEEVMAKEEHARLRRLIAQLSPRESTVVIKRFGLDGREEPTFEELSQSMGVSRERVRQILRKAMRKLGRWWKYPSDDELALAHDLPPGRRARLAREKGEPVRREEGSAQAPARSERRGGRRRRIWRTLG